MLNVMLIDDNKNVLEGLTLLVDWEHLGYNIAAAVRTGKAALEALDETDIDLVITDIRMPQMNGLELITRMREKNPGLKFVLVSGYSEFDYAKWAIDNRICGYLLKPVDEDELTKVVTDVRDTIIKEKESLKQKQDYYLKNVLMGKNEHMDEFFLTKVCKNVRYCMIRPDEKTYIVSNNERSNAENSKLINSAVCGLTDNNYVCNVINDAGETELIICSDGQLGDIKQYLSALNRNLKEQLNFDFLFFVGEQVDVKEIYKSKLSIKKLENSVFYEEGNFFVYDDHKDEQYFGFLPDNLSVERMVYAIKNETEEAVKKAIDDFCTDVKNERIDMKNVLNYIGNTIFDLCNIMIKDGTDSTKYLYRYSLIEKEKYQRIDKVRTFFEENALELRNMFENKRKKNLLGVVSQMMDDVNTNYHNEHLNLQYLAQKYHITAAYLGKIFKKKTKMSFNNYLMFVRIEKAKELLINSDYKIYEIAYKVGFSDPKYFAVKFFAIENTTPAKYRENVLGKDSVE